MTRNLEEITPDTTLKDAAQKMKSRDVGALPVCQADKIVGIVTDRDITVRAVAEGRDPQQTSVAEAMTPDLIYCFEDEDVQKAAKLMEERQIRRLLVLDHNQRAVGIVSLGDLAIRGQDNRLSGEVVERISEPGHLQA
ncbi:MAG TPA: CBS domain-containing protein [Tepidisphaeraceae bacterium]|nr:CBS domain-containing protein [Tepidisphaeraceae bacterium]